MNNITNKRLLWLLPDNTISITLVLESVPSLDYIKPHPQASLIQPINIDCPTFSSSLSSYFWRYNSLTNELYIDKEVQNRELWAEVRQERDKRLLDSDVLLIRAIETGIDISAIKEYRQALRDITISEISEVIWPDIPRL